MLSGGDITKLKLWLLDSNYKKKNYPVLTKLVAFYSEWLSLKYKKNSE